MRNKSTEALAAFHDVGNALRPRRNNGAYSGRRRKRGGSRLRRGLSGARLSGKRRGGTRSNRFLRGRRTRRVRARGPSACRSDFGSCCHPDGAGARMDMFDGKTHSYERGQYKIRAFAKHNSLRGIDWQDFGLMVGSVQPRCPLLHLVDWPLFTVHCPYGSGSMSPRWPSGRW
jgi:hypothetical protein